MRTKPQSSQNQYGLCSVPASTMRVRHLGQFGVRVSSFAVLSMLTIRRRCGRGTRALPSPRDLCISCCASCYAVGAFGLDAARFGLGEL